MAYNNYQGYNQGGYGNNYGGNNYSDNNYTTTSYGAQGGADGGGFMPGSQGGGSQQNKKTYERETIRALTIKQVLDSEEIHSGGEVMIDGQEVTRVCFIGQVRNISRQQTNTTYKMDDGTGTLEVKDWQDRDDAIYEGGQNPNAKKDPIEVGDWAKVNGAIKFNNNRKIVSASVLKKIKDKNEINHHFLEATYVHLYLLKGPPSRQSADANEGGDVYGQQQGAGMGDSGMSQMGGMQNALAGLSALQRKVYTCLKTDGSNEGLHQRLVAERIGVSYEMTVAACQELHELQKIFQTVDDETWAPLDP